MSGWLCFNVTKVHPVDLQKKTKKKKATTKAVDKADPWTRFTAEMAEKAWNV